MSSHSSPTSSTEASENTTTSDNPQAAKKTFTFMPSIVRHISLHAKLTWILLITAIIPILIIAFYSYNKATTSYENTAQLLDTDHVKKGKAIIDHYLQKVPDDLHFLAQFHDLNRYLLWHAIGEKNEANKWLQSTINGFSSFIKSRDLYMQLRVIDAQGWEVIRINRDSTGKVAVSDKRHLQQKSDSQYFIETMQLPANKYYVSTLNLNREHGKIQQPHTPVIRYALPMIDQNGTRHGIIILNLYANIFLDQVTNMDDANHQEGDSFYITNQNGFYLAHPDNSKTFGFDLNHTSMVMLEHPQLWEAIQENQTGKITTDKSIYFLEKIYPLTQNKENYWYLIYSVPRDIHLAELSTFQQVFFGIILFLILILVLISRPIINVLVTPLRKVTNNMQRLERGETELESIEYHGHDELRNMVDAANGMGQRISAAIQQANTIAQGDFHSDITPLSHKDELGIALQSMTRTLQNVANISAAVASGDLRNSINIKGEHDRLGQAINAMITTMRNTANHAHAIADGDFSADIEVHGDNDELGLALQQMSQTLRKLSNVAAAIATGDYTVDVEVKGEQDQLGRSISHMTQALRLSTFEAEQQDWLKSNLTEISQHIQGKTDLHDFAHTIMQLLPRMLEASCASFFVWHDDKSALILEGSFACARGKLNQHVELGEGLTGQCAQDKQIMSIDNIPDDYLSIQSSLGESKPRNLIEVPLLADGDLSGVMEFACLVPLNDIQLNLLQQLSPLLGMAVFAIQNNLHTKRLLEESQSLSEELQAQEEELREANAALEMRAEELSTSEEELQAQQEELRSSNEELLAKNKTVEAQKNALKASAESLAKQAKNLQQASQYKSDFLSNMSHELRTPLNSLLILSDMLAKNKDGNLSDKQVEFASTIHASGADLLELINSILDLAKVEAGKMELDPHRFPLQDISDSMQRGFAHMAEKKGIALRIEQASDVPKFIFSDAMRIKQVLKNLLSNALKFTLKGEVVFSTERFNEDCIRFNVKDSGVGIAADKLHDVFEAFQQEDGSTSRKYGGTGLGLSICRELSKLLGGHISVESEQGKGSCFALIIPLASEAVGKRNENTNDSIIASPISVATTDTALLPPLNEEIASDEQEDSDSTTDEQIPNLLADDRDNINPGDHSILIIEDDESFASIQQGLVREHGFKAINALRGDHGLLLAQQYIPNAILLDLQLPVLNGMSLLDRLKAHPKLKHIPVHVISCMDMGAEKRVLQAGAISFVHKPVKQAELDNILDDISAFIERDIKHLLLVEDDDKQLTAMSALLAGNDVKIITAQTGAEVLQILRADHVDCMILDLTLPDMGGEDILAAIQQGGDSINQGQLLPVIVHTGKDLSEQEVELLQGMSKSIIIKGSYSPDRLLAETSLFLHQVEESMSEDKQHKINKLRENDVDIAGKSVLLVDDDIRNIYSLSSYLEGHQLHVRTARNGLEALHAMQQHGDKIDLILMDIMMPEMDGFEATREIRKINQHQNLPIIALTAKAMKGDREQCIAAGVSDYITKPVNTDKLISLMRVWLHE